MRSIDAYTLSALQAGSLIARDLFWITAKSRVDSTPYSVGFSSDGYTKDRTVIDGIDGISYIRNFTAAKSLLNIPEIPLVADISVRRVPVQLSQIDENVINAVRGYDIRNAPIQIYRLLLNTITQLQIAPAWPRFVGFVDECVIQTPSENQEGYIEMTCVSHTTLLTRANTDVRSHESQILRSATDTFYKDTASVGDWTIYWGEAKAKSK